MNARCTTEAQPSRPRITRMNSDPLPRFLECEIWILAAIALFSPIAEVRAEKVYGEWLIRVKPDQGPAYNDLIEKKGLPLFREAGGRMVGWWNTLIGDLYEHVTIWEYDDMPAFEKAVQFLGGDKRFAEFVKLRDPLLAGEESRFLKLAAGAEPPVLHDPAKFVIHEIHRVPLRQQKAYLNSMEKDGLRILKKHGFRVVGPWVAAVGKWTEVTYLFRFDSLAERDQLIANFSRHADSKTYGKITELVDEITTRLLLPTRFAVPPKQAGGPPKTSALMPHLEEIAPGVYGAGFANRYRSANCGWIALENEALLVDLPYGIATPDFLREVERISGQPARSLVLTRCLAGDARIVESLVENGIKTIHTSEGVRASLLGASKKFGASVVHAVTEKTSLGDANTPVELIPLDQVASPGAAALHLPRQHVLFAGPLAFNGPRAPLPGADLENWIHALRRLEALGASRVVPGFGSWGDADVLARERRFLTELRRQVGWFIAQGKPHDALQNEIRIPADYLVWMPYDHPSAEDIEHVYQEMTVPIAPFHGRPPEKSDSRPHALILYGDLPHEPGHIEEGLRPVFEAGGVVPHFAVDVRALSSEALSQVRLLVVLRDGLQRPQAESKSHYVWMTSEQQRAVVEFVEAGGGFLNLHNSMGLYPDDGPYLKLVGGRYVGHGPLERFRVEVVDRDHPITRGVGDFSVADEQHTPPYDAQRVHLLLRNRSDAGAVAAAGWAYEPGRGRVCHLANGHTRESLLHPAYQSLLRNALNWCLRRESGGETARR